MTHPVNPTVLRVEPVVVRCKDGNLQPDNKDYERLLTPGHWVVITKNEIQSLLREGAHILWNPESRKKEVLVSRK